MYIPVKLGFCIFSLLLSAQYVAAEEWRGIVPLRSTREDVVRLLGECSDQPGTCSFTLPNEEILIVFARDFCPEGAPPDTVLMIERQLQKGTTLSALGLDKRRFKTFNPWYPGNTSYLAYIDEKSGLLLKSLRGEIFQINYIPTKNARPTCARFYRKPKEFVNVTPEHVPWVNIRCPQTASAGDKIVITADYARTGEHNLLTWRTTGGKIVEGQNTRKLLLDTTGLEGQITVTVERHNGNFGRMPDSCVVRILPKPK